ncbi:hypothetical protein NDU88_002081 [Pleurodeles waltl]|uniref:Reverse transcriptase domain-containing protein n=1 Tax=Pleurodeles waltl TaxID=8319 RepID=A0AAV7WK83_PLEWA|nr:hypothetical protein NDU88_002081 [Pleurodeles waltl]
MDRTLRALGLGDFFCDVVSAMYRDTSSTALVNGWRTDPFPVLSGVRQGCPLSPLLFIWVIELLAERIRQNRDIRGVIVPGSSGKGEVKCSLYMDDVSVFCVDGHSIKELEKTCIEFGKASGAKINSAKSETLLFGHWTPTRDPLPFPIKQDVLKILGVWFGGKGAAEKSWEERLAKTKQKLGLWSLRKLTIEGKSLVLRNETLQVLLYVSQVWPVQPRTAKAITRMIFYFIWNSKMDRVKREVMFKTHDKGGKGVPDIATILRGTFVCHCVRNTLRAKDESHAGFLMARFFCYRRGGDLVGQNGTAQSPTTGKPHGFTKKWRSSSRSTVRRHQPRRSGLQRSSIHRQIRARDVSEPIGALPSATADHVWRNVASKRLTNQHKDIAWLAIQGGLPVRAFMHARGLNRYKSCPRGCTADETTYHLFWECAYAQDLLKALSMELGAWIPTTCITADSVMYGLFPGSHALGDLQGCWRLLCCLKDVLLFSRNRLVVRKKETSTLGCWKMIHSLLRDYAALDGSDDET